MGQLFGCPREGPKTTRSWWAWSVNLEYMSWALQMRWLWHARTDKNKSWTGLDMPINSNAVALFNIGLECHVGNGENIYFQIYG